MRYSDLTEAKKKRRKKAKLRRGYYGMVGYPWSTDDCDGGDLTESKQTDEINRLIKKCRFSASDRDRATTGFCGTFALALHRFLKKQNIESQLILVCPKSNDGDYPVGNELGVSWGHVCVRVGDQYYDINGRQTPKQMFDEFIWGFGGGEAGKGYLLEITEPQLILVLRDCQKDSKNAYSFRHRRRWDKRFAKRQSDVHPSS